jgi:hypothetical protein
MGYQLPYNFTIIIINIKAGIFIYGISINLKITVNQFIEALLIVLK